MNPKKHPIKPLGKIAAGLLCVTSLTLASSALAQVTVATSNQQGTANTWPFTPTWTPATDSLIAGLTPTTATGNFSQEIVGRNVNTLTAGGSLTLNQVAGTSGNTCSPNYVSYGNGSGSGSLLLYTLPASANGYNLTNITVDGGWANNGRDALGFTVLYSTVANPTNFIYLATVNYNPSVSANTPSANQAIIKNAVAGGQIAANVAAVEFILNFPSVENGYCGIGAITVEGTAATSRASAVAITTANQSGTSPLTPTWTAETPNLIAGLLPSSSSGNFGLEASGGLPVLTDGAIGKSGTIGGFATCGASGGTSLIYTLTNVVNGTDVTNIVVYSGWGDTGRFGQYYTLSYSTIAAPTTFIPLTTIFYWPGVLSENGGGSAQANRVAIFNSTNGVLASGVANLKFDFSSPTSASSFNNGYQGYSEIIVQGNDTATPPPPPSPLLSQDILPSYAATVVGDQVVFTATFSNSPPVSLQWQFINTNNVVSNIPGATSATLTLNNVQVSDSGSYRLEALNATNGSAAPSFTAAAPLVVNGTPAPVGNVIMNYAEQSGQGPLSLVNTSTNFYPTWTVDTANDLILGSLTNTSPNSNVPGTFIAGTGNFDMNIPVYGTNNGPLSPDPTILSDGSGGYISYWVNVGGNITQCSCGVGGAGDTMTYTLPSSAANGFDVTNITVYGGWGDSGRNEQKYQVLYSTIYNPTAFTSLGTFDYNPNNPANRQSATRTILIPVSGALAKNVAAVQINWNVSSAPKNNWEGYSEIVVKGTPSGINPILVQDTLPSYAATVVGDQVTFTAAFSNAPAVNLQWQFVSTNNVVSDIPGATTTTLALNNLQLANTGSYRLKATSVSDGTAVVYSTPAPLVVNSIPAPVGNILVTTANQSGLGPISGVNNSTNFTPTWTLDTTGDLILNSVYDGSFPGFPGDVYPGAGNFSPLNSGCNSDPEVLSDDSIGYQNYYPGIGGNQTLCAGGNSGGYSVTYTLPSSDTGWSLTNLTVYGGFGNNSRDELKYQVLYSTVSAPTVFNNLINVDFNPTVPNSSVQSSTRTTLVPVTGAMAQNVYAVEINFFNAASVSENGWSGYSEIFIGGQPSPAVPVVSANITPGAAEDVVGSSLTLTASFTGATSYQWLKDGTNVPGATSSSLTINNLQFSDQATNIGYSLVAFNSSGSNTTAFCKVYVDPAPAPAGNVITAYAYQTSPSDGFSPTWDTSMLGSSLIAGQTPPIVGYDPVGNFNDPDVGAQANNLAGGLPVLTDGNYGTFVNSGAHPAFATAGPGGPAPGAGQYVIYQLGNYSPNANGYDITNIQVASGWNDNGRSSQFYTISYSTVANPTMFIPLVIATNNLSSGNSKGGGTGGAVPSGAGIPTTVRATFTPASGLLASNVYAIYVDFTVPNNVPNAYSGYSQISVFGSPSATAPANGPVITTQHEETNNTWTVETPNLIANQLPNSFGAGVFTEEGCNITNLTDGAIGFGATYGASCGDDGVAVPWIIFNSANGWNLTNIVVYTLWHDYGRDGQYYTVSYSTLAAPTTFIPITTVAYNPFVPHDGRASGNRVAIAPPVGQTSFATNVAAVKFDFTSQGVQDFGWSGYSEIVLQGSNLAGPPVPPTLNRPIVSGGNLILTGTGGTPNTGYTWLTTTNLTTPLANWMVSVSGTFDSNGAFSNSIPVNTVQPASFFRLRTP